MKKISIYPIAVLAFLFSSCTKEDFEIDLSGLGGGGGGGWGIPVYNYHAFDFYAIRHIQIQQGRYFIYKDPGTGAIDSVITTESSLSTVNQPPAGSNPAFSYQKYTLTLTSFTATGNQTWYRGFASCDSLYKGPPRFIDSTYSLVNDQDTLPSFWYPYTSSGNLQYRKIPAMNIEGTIYYYVNSFSASNGLPPTDPGYLATTFWWVDDIGIIKREIRTIGSVKTWHLLRYG